MALNEISNQKTIQQIINDTSSKTAGRNTGELGKDDFLNLLITQLRYQDPLKPVDDKEFIGQMAQFSSLEQMQNMNSSLSHSQAFSLIGKHITAKVTDDVTKAPKVVEGEVSSVKMSGGKTYIVVNGEDIPVERVNNVAETSKDSKLSNVSQYTGLIGFVAKGMLYDPNNASIIPVSGTVKAVQKGTYEDYAVMSGVRLQISGIVTNSPSTDPDFFDKYLSEHLPPKDNLVTVLAVDSESGKKVPVTGRLLGYDTINGNTAVVMDDVQVSVDSIYNISAANNDPDTGFNSGIMEASGEEQGNL